jgi:hypothetical protein
VVGATGIEWGQEDQDGLKAWIRYHTIGYFVRVGLARGDEGEEQTRKAS